MPRAKVIAPDLPVHPEEAVALLHDICDREKPDLIIGTSMGGMYAEQLYGFDRICVNPALEMGETMRAHGMTGTQQFQNPRLDGVQEFYVDKALVKEYKEQSEKRFEGVLPNTQHPSPDTQELQRVWGLFGDEDTTVDTYDMFRAVYPQALHFHGEHRMNDKSFMHSVVPVIRWIDDRQEGRERPIIYIGVETLADSWQKLAETRLVCAESGTPPDRALPGVLRWPGDWPLGAVARGAYQRARLAPHHLHLPPRPALRRLPHQPTA